MLPERVVQVREAQDLHLREGAWGLVGVRVRGGDRVESRIVFKGGLKEVDAGAEIGELDEERAERVKSCQVVWEAF